MAVDSLQLQFTDDLLLQYASSIKIIKAFGKGDESKSTIKMFKQVVPALGISKEGETCITAMDNSKDLDIITSLENLKHIFSQNDNGKELIAALDILYTLKELNPTFLLHILSEKSGFGDSVLTTEIKTILSKFDMGKIIKRDDLLNACINACSDVSDDVIEDL